MNTLPTLRAWDIQNKKMLNHLSGVLWGKAIVPTDYVQGIFDYQIPNNYEGMFEGEMMMVSEVEIMLSSGLPEKNNNEIYDGDIVKSVGRTTEFKGVVYFNKGSFWVREFYTNVDEGAYDGDVKKETIWSIDLDYEVLGNRYENPELLSEKHVR